MASLLRKLVIAAIFIVPTVGAATARCSADQIFLRGDWGQTRFAIEVADSIPERSKGLMHRATLARDSGMLFIYKRPKSVSFWMKNTLIPLDMLFIDRTGTVKNIHHNAIPLDTTQIYGGDKILAVLEINGGLAESLGILEGTQVRHPAFSPTKAIWPCD